jgi:hypothetical protein
MPEFDISRSLPTKKVAPDATAASVLLFPGYLGQSGSRCALLAGWDRVVHKSRTTAAAAAGASYLAGKESINSFGFQKSVPAATAAGVPY